jgi:CheY-like chemotaxis protein
MAITKIFSSLNLIDLPKDMKKKKVLIVEDEMIISLLIEKMVMNLGHQVLKKVPSGEEAVKCAIEEEPDIILMDIRLDGEINGIEAMSQIHKDRNIPVIYISGNTDALTKGKLSDSDYVDFLPKPITISDLTRSFSFAS